jgi:hypothetical protein
VTRGLRCRAFSLWALLCQVVSVAALADEGPAAAPVAAIRVEVTVVGTVDDFRWARSLIGSGSPALVSSRWTRAERFDSSDLFADVAPGLACWLDLTDARRARLYFAAPAGQRFVLRDVALSGAHSEVDRAALAEVIALSVAALLENERAGLSRGEAETVLAERKQAESTHGEPARELAPPPARPAPDAGAKSTAAGRTRFGFAALFSDQVLSTGLPLAQSGSVEAIVGHLGEATWLAGYLAGEYQFPITARNADIGVRLQTVAAQVGVEAGHRRQRPDEATRFWWRSWFVRLGAGVDFTYVSPQPGTVPASLMPAHWSSALVGRGALGTSWALGAWLALDVRLFADVLPTAVHYDVNVDGEARRRAFVPWRIRPGIALGVALR